MLQGLARRSVVTVALSIALATSVVIVATAAVWAASGPRITKALMLDANRDGHADGVMLTYSVLVNHTTDTSGSYPFSVEGYAITSVGAAAASTTMTIYLAQRAVGDLTVTPFITYSGRTTPDPVVSTTGSKAVNQSFIGTKAVKPAKAVYVALTGNDGNAGTQLLPKLTIHAAVAAAALRTPIPAGYGS